MAHFSPYGSFVRIGTIEITVSFGERTVELWTGPGHGPHSDKTWIYAAVLPADIGEPISVTFTDTDPPVRVPIPSGHVFTKTPYANHVHVDDACLRTTPLMYIDEAGDHSTHTIKGVQQEGKLYTPVVRETDFKPIEEATEIETAMTAVCIEASVFAYQRVDGGVAYSTKKIPPPKTTVMIPDVPKMRAVAVSAKIEVTETETPDDISRVVIKCTGKVGSTRIYLRPLSFLESRAAPRPAKKAKHE